MVSDPGLQARQSSQVAMIAPHVRDENFGAQVVWPLPAVRGRYSVVARRFQVVEISPFCRSRDARTGFNALIEG